MTARKRPDPRRLKIPSFVRPCTDTFGRKALAFLAAEHFQRVKKRDLEAALLKDGIDAKKLDDKALVEAAAAWLCKHAKYQDSFTTFVTAFDAQGAPFIPSELAPAIPASGDARKLAAAWERDISARGMFAHAVGDG